MTQPRFYRSDPNALRQMADRIRQQALSLQFAEQELIGLLHEMDRDRVYVRFGYKSLKGHCIHALELSRTQSQRIITRVRRLDPPPPLAAGPAPSTGPQLLADE